MAQTRERVTERVIMMPPSLWRQLRILAAKSDRTASGLVREAVQDLLERHKARGSKSN